MTPENSKANVPNYGLQSAGCYVVVLWIYLLLLSVIVHNILPALID